MNPLFQAMSGSNNKIGQVAGLVKMLRSGNPEQMAQQLMANNPQFRAFVEANQGKAPEQVAKENGMDFNRILGMMK